ncbi:hypothetical protein E4U40_000836 [Claviceps sp. LM458 group G5]|nr:hypothetical protein E4U40_000836 [Claviceps sp. LM458 group G5]KAG6049193.1 hypothetical protein E4U39_006384 [Claviceps sp. Clav50 group G5]
MAEDRATKATKQSPVSISVPKSTFGIDSTLSVAALCRPCAPAARMQEPVARWTKQEDSISDKLVSSYHDQKPTSTTVNMAMDKGSVFPTGTVVQYDAS